MNKKELIETTFKEREDFIDRQADKNIYGWVCPVHNIVIGKEHLCPLCEKERLDKESGLDIKEKGLLVGTKTKEELLMARDVKRKKDKEYMRKKLKDPDQKKKHYEAVNRYYQKERLRKKEHSLIN
jgi:hypothetical protein